MGAIGYPRRVLLHLVLSLAALFSSPAVWCALALPSAGPGAGCEVLTAGCGMDEAGGASHCADPSSFFFSTAQQRLMAHA